SENKARNGPWTYIELTAFLPKLAVGKEKWKLSASHGSDKLKNAIDSDPSTRWDTGTDQVPGMWFQIELPEALEVARIHLNAANSAGDYPRGYKVEISLDGKTYGKPVAEGKGT